MSSSRLATVLAAVFVIAGCKGKSQEGEPAHVTPPSSGSANRTSVPMEPPAPTDGVAEERSPRGDRLMEPLDERVEAIRSTLAEPVVRELTAEIADVTRDRYRMAPEHVVAQMIPLANGGRAVLLSADSGPPLGFLLVLDAQRRIAWTKERPTAGMRPEVGPLTLAPAPDGGVLLVFYEPEHHVIGARRWEGAGGLLADFQVGELEACDSLGALRWGDHGWVIVAGQQGRLLGQLLTDGAKLAWGSGGKLLFDGSGAASSPVLSLDTDASLAVLSSGLSSAKAPRYWLSRFDVSGAPLLRTPVEIGPAPPPGTASSTKPRVRRIAPGVLRLDLPRAGGSDVVDVTSEGGVILH
jgi:hypothetical protein